MIPKFVMSNFLSSDFERVPRVICGYCHRKILRIDKEALDRHVIFAHMPPSEVSRELRRNSAMGHP